MSLAQCLVNKMFISPRGYVFKKGRPFKGVHYLRGQAGRKPGDKGGKIEERQEVVGERKEKATVFIQKGGGGWLDILGCNLRLGLLKICGMSK